MNTSKIAAIITAGGVSRRFGSNKLLENITLNNKKVSVICASVEKFIKLSSIIVIPCHKEVREHIKNSGIYKSEKIIFANPGETRQKSVYNGLKKLKEYAPNNVLIHDGARPFIEEETIKAVINKLDIYKGVCTGIWSVDTIKITNKNSEILKTVDRNTVFQAQTPQGFRFETILDAHTKLKDKDFTDDCCLLEYLNIPVYALLGNIANKKITFREDLTN